MIKFSIIIPLYIASKRFAADLDRFALLDYRGFEIIIVCDKNTVFSATSEKTRVIKTGKDNTGPAEKRDLAISEARGELCAFIDDDAYPHPTWLSAALKNFDDPLVGAVGGPGLTPPEDGFWEKAGGAVYESFVTSGRANMRFLRKKKADVDDWPAYNLIIRKDLLKKIKGFDSTFYGGEDTKVCLAILKAGQRIVYDPDLVVYHHRRSLFAAHLRQVANVAYHRGYFVKVYPRTSLRPFYFLPLFICEYFALLFGLGFFRMIFAEVMISSLCLYYCLSFLGIRTHEGFKMRLIAAAGAVLTHFIYGINFLRGLFTVKMEK